MNKLQWGLVIVLALGLMNNCHQQNVVEQEVADIMFRSTYGAVAYDAAGGSVKMVIEIRNQTASEVNKTYHISYQFIGDRLTTDSWSGKLIADDVTEVGDYYHVGLDQWKFGGGMTDDAIIIIPKSTSGLEPLSIEIDPTRDRVYGRVWKFEKMSY